MKLVQFVLVFLAIAAYGFVVEDALTVNGSLAMVAVLLVGILAFNRIGR